MKKICFACIVFISLLINSSCTLLLPALTENNTVLGVTNNSINYEITYESVKTWTDSIGNNWAQVIVEFKNTGDNPIYLSSGSYDLEYTDGTVVANKNYISIYPEILQSGEKGYLYDESILDIKPMETLVVKPRINPKKATVPSLRLDVKQVTLSDVQYLGPKAIGKIENSTNKDITSTIYVAIVLYNSKKEPIGILTDLITENLAAKNSIGYEATNIMLPDEITVELIDSYVAYCYPHQYQFN